MKSKKYRVRTTRGILAELFGWEKAHNLTREWEKKNKKKFINKYWVTKK